MTPSWRPKKREVYYQDRPDWVPAWVYTEALAAKRYYNENWEFFVWQTSLDYNVSQAKAEDACIRGLKTAIDRLDFVYGPKVAKWYREFMEMDSIINKVKHPEYRQLKLAGVDND
jgi:hypothetical protein